MMILRVGDSLEDVQPFKPWGFLDVFCLPGGPIITRRCLAEPEGRCCQPRGSYLESREFSVEPGEAYPREAEYVKKAPWLERWNSQMVFSSYPGLRVYVLPELTLPVRPSRGFPPLLSLVYQTESLPEPIGLWFSLDVCQRLLSYRWKHRWDPSRHARLHRPLCLLRGIEGFRVPFLRRGCYTRILTRRTFRRCSRPVDWGCEVEFSSADFL
ncbi:hypothetical protein F2Q68_00015201 [Brassica cretica]|uniref:Uncharacterized protein n=1 Tax=Brassica cretica TaxID=69181 RepID=A0A8S9HQG9_BRACR|nr:hypothetical protein F2Q68_00015201 [Brassica cretica]